MKKVIIATLFLVSIGILITYTVFGQRGIVDLLRLQNDLSELQAQNEQLKNENTRLKNEIELLKNNDRYLEETARSELGLVKKEEMIYQLKKSDKR